MYTHAPQDYVCPLCLAINGIESEDTMMKQDDIVYRDDLVLAAINSKFIGNNSGHVIVFPLRHFENIFNLPDKEANQIMLVAKQMALALKKIRNCDGITILQNNEPAGDQPAFHYHMHIIPRFNDDKFRHNFTNTTVSSPDDRKPYSNALRKFLSQN